MKSKILIATLSLVLLTLSNQAFAWGDREQGALTGFVLGAIIGNQSRHDQQNAPVYTPVPVYSPPPVVYIPAPVYSPPPVVYVYPAAPYRSQFRQRVDVYIPECNCYRTIEVITR